MFEQEHLNAVKDTFNDQIPDILDERAETLRKEYEKLDIVDEASVNVVDGYDVQITISLTFEPRDEEQNIPAVIEYGGVIYDVEDNARNIEPSYLIRRFFADGVA